VLPPPVATPRRVLSLPEALGKLDQYGETALFACLHCGEESAKASVPLGIWHCTACARGGRLVPPKKAGVEPI